MEDDRQSHLQEDKPDTDEPNRSVGETFQVSDLLSDVDSGAETLHPAAHGNNTRREPTLPRASATSVFTEPDSIPSHATSGDEQTGECEDQGKRDNPPENNVFHDSEASIHVSAELVTPGLEGSRDSACDDLRALAIVISLDKDQSDVSTPSQTQHTRNEQTGSFDELEGNKTGFENSVNAELVTPGLQGSRYSACEVLQKEAIDISLDKDQSYLNQTQTGYSDEQEGETHDDIRFQNSVRSTELMVPELQEDRDSASVALQEDAIDTALGETGSAPMNLPQNQVRRETNSAGSPRSVLPTGQDPQSPDAGGISLPPHSAGRSDNESVPEPQHVVPKAVLVDYPVAEVVHPGFDSVALRKYCYLIWIGVGVLAAAVLVASLIIVLPGTPTPTDTPSFSPSVSPLYTSTNPSLRPTGTDMPSCCSEPSPSPTPGSFECFENRSQLEIAVDAYLLDGSRTTDFAMRYGWPIGSWCVDKITDLQDLFSVQRNWRSAFFNESLSGWNVSSVTLMSSLFQGASLFDQDLSSWDTSRVRFMSFIFQDAVSFNGSIGTWNVSSVRNFLSAFSNATSFNQDLPWDVSAASSMESMFWECENFDGDVSTWNTEKVEMVESMFEGASSFDQDLSSWDLSRVVSLDRMFAGATSFNGNVTSWDVSLVTMFRETFLDCSVFDRDISSWSVSSGTDFTRMLSGATSFRQDLCSWSPHVGIDALVQQMFTETACERTDDPSLVSDPPGPFCSTCDYRSSTPSASSSPSTSVTPSLSPSASAQPSSSSSPSLEPSTSSAPSIFVNCFENTTQLYNAVDRYLSNSANNTVVAAEYGWPIGNWCVSEVTSFAGLFSAERNALAESFDDDISQWTTSSVTSMDSMFKGNIAFNGDLSQWNTSRVVTFVSMFHDAISFNRDLSMWDTSSATNMRHMFHNASSFNGRLDGWNTARVTDISRMFLQARAFNQDLSSWDVSSVLDMERCFSVAHFFNQNLSSWDVSKVTKTSSMFEEARNFNGDIRNWNLSRLERSARMFRDAVSFNQNLSGWKIAPDHSSMEKMFMGATSFNGDISTWDVTSVQNFDDFLRGATSFNQDLSQWEVQFGVWFRDMFNGASSFRQNLCDWRFGRGDNILVDRMFTGSGCESTADPDLSVEPVSPICFRCPS